MRYKGASNAHLKLYAWEWSSRVHLNRHNIVRGGIRMPVLGQRPVPRRLPLPERLPGRQRTDMVVRQTAQGKRSSTCCLGPAEKLYWFGQNECG